MTLGCFILKPHYTAEEKKNKKQLMSVNWCWRSQKCMSVTWGRDEIWSRVCLYETCVLSTDHAASGIKLRATDSVKKGTFNLWMHSISESMSHSG